MAQCSTLPARAGAGFKPAHFADIVGGDGSAGFFEVHAENYMGAGGPPHARLNKLRTDYPLSIHGVGLSIGGPGPLNADHLARLRALCDRYQPALFSEHLAWSSHTSGYLNDLLALPYTNETLAIVCRHIDEVQDALARPVLLENPSTYVSFTASDWDEASFIAEVWRRTGCGLLLDVNNVHVSAVNHGWDPVAYVDRLPLDAVGEIHLAGHAKAIDGAGDSFLIDDHGAPVHHAVWALYRHVLEKTGPLPTLIEWDTDVPAWQVLVAEVERADSYLRQVSAACHVA